MGGPTECIITLSRTSIPSRPTMTPVSAFRTAYRSACSKWHRDRITLHHRIHTVAIRLIRYRIIIHRSNTMHAANDMQHMQCCAMTTADRMLSALRHAASMVTLIRIDQWKKRSQPQPWTVIHIINHSERYRMLLYYTHIHHSRAWLNDFCVTPTTFHHSTIIIRNSNNNSHQPPQKHTP